MFHVKKLHEKADLCAPKKQSPDCKAPMTDYKPLFWLQNHHLNTIIPNRFRTFPDHRYHRVRIPTPDGDFLHLDFTEPFRKVTGQTAIIVHGLEGSSQSGYAKGLSRILHDAGYTTVVLNLRSCGGVPNNKLQSYHSGKTDDLHTAVQYLIEQGASHIKITGFSLGGNIALKYAGEAGKNLPPQVKQIAAVSAPCDLHGSSKALSKPSNKIYLNRFLQSLKNKAIDKLNHFEPSFLDESKIRKATTFYEFDDAFTAPVHGFESAADYYTKCSSKTVLNELKIPALVINAQDDSFLSESCYPRDEAENNPFLHVLTPQKGGHVGFTDRWPLRRAQWHERVILYFFEKQTTPEKN